MKRLFSLFLALLIFFTGKNSIALAMSPQQEELYQAAIVELNVYKALKLLQKNNIDLNEPIEINGRHTTFLHELLRVSTEFHRDQISIDQNISDDSDALLMGSPRYNSILSNKQMQKNYKKEINFELDYSLYQLFRLFLGFGANVDLSNNIGMSAREVARNFQTSQGNNPLNFIANFPMLNDANYEEYRDRTRNDVVTAIKNRNFSYTALISLFGIFLYIIFYYFI